MWFRPSAVFQFFFYNICSHVLPCHHTGVCLFVCLFFLPLTVSLTWKMYFYCRVSEFTFPSIWNVLSPNIPGLNFISLEECFQSLLPVGRMVSIPEAFVMLNESSCLSIFYIHWKYLSKMKVREVPGSSVPETLCSQCRGPGLIPGRGSRFHCHN